MENSIDWPVTFAFIGVVLLIIVVFYFNLKSYEAGYKAGYEKAIKDRFFTKTKI